MSPPPTSNRGQLRRQWQEYADALFDRLFPGAEAQPPSLDRLEQRPTAEPDDSLLGVGQFHLKSSAAERPSHDAWAACNG